MSEYNDRRGTSSGGRFSFEEGYTSQDNRSRRAQDGGRDGGVSSGRQQPSGGKGGQRGQFGGGDRFGGRFIDTGDRYMRGLGGEADSQPGEGRGAPTASRYVGEGYSSGGYTPSARYSDDYRPGGGRQPAGRDEYYDERGDFRPSRRAQSDGYYEDYDGAAGSRGNASRYAGESYPPRRDGAAQRSPQRGGRSADRVGYATPDRTGRRTAQPGGTRYARQGRGGTQGGIAGWLSSLTNQQMTWLMVGAAAVLVLIILAVCLILQSDGCKGCGQDNADIPVIEQGDGDEAPGGYIDDTPPGDTEVVSTSDGTVTIDEELDTDEFTVEVVDADGSYGRTGVHRAEAATLVITDQNSTGFAFSMEVKAEGVQGDLSGYAYFCGAKEAVYEGAEGRLNFSFGSSGVTVYQTDIIAAFEDVTPDGVYIAGSPTYIEDEAEQSQELGLDASIRTSEAVREVLSSLLSENDLVLYDFIFENGTERVFEGSEKGYDMNGVPINIDAELGAVKYYAFINGTGEEVMLICTKDALVYIGVCDGAAYRYYTNDPDYAEKAPRAISGQAKGKGVELTYVSGQ